MKKVTTSNLDQCRSSTLIKAFEKLDEISGEDTRITIQAVELQVKISQKLEARGWVYDEANEDWVYPL